MPKFKDDDDDSLPTASRLSHSLDDEERVDLEGELPGALRDEEDPWEDPNGHGSILARRGQSLFDEVADDEDEDFDDEDEEDEEELGDYE